LETVKATTHTPFVEEKGSRRERAYHRKDQALNKRAYYKKKLTPGIIKTEA